MEFEELRTYMRRRRLKAGNCLSHVIVLTRLPRHLQGAVLVCMGPGEGRKLHCWLEHQDTVIDLTKSERFFGRTDYYARAAIVRTAVRRYPVADAAHRLLSGGLTFWEFDPDQYVTLEPKVRGK